MTNEDIAVRIQNGEKELISELWNNTYKLLYLMSDKFYKRNTERCRACGVELEDIQQSCYFALCEAVRAYKQESEYKFTAYINYSFKNAVAALLNGGHRRQITDPLNKSISLDVPLSEDAETTKADLLPDDAAEQGFENAENDIYNMELHEALEKAVQIACNSREADILRLMYWDGKTYQSIADTLNISVSYVGTTHHRALRQLRHGRAILILQPYADFIKTHAYHGTGLSAFRSSGISSVERIAEQWNEISGASRDK